MFLCDRCFEAACKLRRRDRRDPHDGRDLHCSFDGKSLRELRELCVSDDGLAFCDECAGLIEEVLRDAVHMRLFGLRLADADDRCAWCGAGRDESTLVRARRGHAFCVSCIHGAPRIGRWCGRCGVPSWRTQGILNVGGAAWCVGCVRREARVAALIVAGDTRVEAR